MVGSEPQPGPRRVPVERLGIHQAIVDHLGVTPGDVVLDLGCGSGLTLAAAARRVPRLSLIGIDVNREAVAAAQSWLAETDADCRWLVRDLQAPLPLADGSVTRVVSHDVLEHLDDPGRLLAEAARVMTPGAVSVRSHVDYEATLVGGADRLLTRRIVTAYADAGYLALGRSDAQMARKLAAIVDRSPLRRVAIDTAALIATSFDGPGRHRIDDIAATVTRSARQGDVAIEPAEIDDWGRFPRPRR